MISEQIQKFKKPPGGDPAGGDRSDQAVQEDPGSPGVQGVRGRPGLQYSLSRASLVSVAPDTEAGDNRARIQPPFEVIESTRWVVACATVICVVIWAHCHQLT